MRNRFGILGGLVATGALTAAALSPAQAATTSNLIDETWGYGSYHASTDFTLSAGNVHLQVKCDSGGSAKYAYVGAAQTSNGNRVGTASYSYPCNGKWAYGGRNLFYAQGGTAYYVQWYGQYDNLTNGANAPGAGAGAYR